MDTTVNKRLAKRDQAGLFSSASSFFLPVGEHFEASAVRGYYIDMRGKARMHTWQQRGAWLHVVRIQWGLGCFERYLAGEGKLWLDAATGCAEELLMHQHPTGPQAGGFLHSKPLPHTFRLSPPWISAMAQGEAASLFVRVFQETGDERFAHSARRALLPLGVGSAEGGVRARLGGGVFFEEYPTQPPSFVLNGGIFAIWGLYDVALALDDTTSRKGFEEALETLIQNIGRWDTGYWSRYDLFPHPTTNVASSFYHDLHVNQLRAMHRLTGRGELIEAADRWAGYAASPLSRTRATARKLLFRLLVPRNRRLAARVPWSRLQRG